jgi:radical SAM superfamily enzyme YgiQ (UPF0313 family)
MTMERHDVSATDSSTTIPEVLFVHVPKRSSYYKPLDEFMFINYIPMGVFGLCDLVNKAGIPSRIKHLGLELILDETFSIVNFLRHSGVKLVAMSLHWHYQAYDVIEVARKIKDAIPEMVIVLGGFTASIFPREILDSFPFVDCIIAGDGEKGIVELARVVCRSGVYASVANGIYRSNGQIVDNGITYLADYTELSHVDYANLSYLDHYLQYRDFFKMPLFWSLNLSIEKNRRKQISGASTTFPLMVGRGCNYNCSFCGGGAKAQKRICTRDKAVFMPVDHVVDTMEQALRFGYESFIVCFDPDPADSSYFVKLFAEVRRRNLSCGMGFESWGIPTRAFIEAFAGTFTKDSSYIALSPETASEEQRKKHKGYFYSNRELFNCMEIIEAHSVPSIVYFTAGLPGATSEIFRQNRLFAQQLRKRFKHLLTISMVPIQLEPPSPMFENPGEFNITSYRTSFTDFYTYHQKPESNPYTDLGYVAHSFGKAAGHPDTFNGIIQQQRCNQFCIIPVKLFGRFYLPWLSRLLCTLLHKGWTRRGFGRAPAVRKTFG